MDVWSAILGEGVLWSEEPAHDERASKPDKGYALWKFKPKHSDGPWVQLHVTYISVGLPDVLIAEMAANRIAGGAAHSINVQSEESHRMWRSLRLKSGEILAFRIGGPPP